MWEKQSHRNGEKKEIMFCFKIDVILYVCKNHGNKLLKNYINDDSSSIRYGNDIKDY